MDIATHIDRPQMPQIWYLFLFIYMEKVPQMLDLWVCDPDI